MLVEDYEKAEKTLEFVMKENKGKSWYIWQYGVCLWQLGKHDKAIAAFKKVSIVNCLRARSKCERATRGTSTQAGNQLNS